MSDRATGVRRYRLWLPALVIGFLTAIVPLSRGEAACARENRSIEVAGYGATRLQGVACTITAEARRPELRVEKYELSEAAAAALVSQSGAQAFLGPLGRAQLLNNRVSEIYRDLVTRFSVGIRIEQSQTAARLDFGKAGEVFRDIPGSPGKVFRTLYGDASIGNPYYPAVNEIESLSRNRLPEGARFYYEGRCLDKPLVRGVCEKLDTNDTRQVIWRSMTSEDAREFSNKVTRLNAILRGMNKSYPGDSKPPQGLALLDHIAGGRWPENLVTISGSQTSEDLAAAGCIPTGWVFSFKLPALSMEVISIENLSDRPMRLDGLMGSMSREIALRPARTSGADELRTGVGLLLPPRAKLLVPVGLSLSNEHQVDADMSRVIFDKLGTNRMAGNPSSYKIPERGEFVFGPMLDIRTLVIDGQSVPLAEQVANLMTLTVSSLGGSCPYLSHQTASGEWIENGKILHEAQGEGNKMSQSIVLPGLVKSFRIEEREPEVAHIYDAKLLLRTPSGDAIELGSDAFAGRENPISLWWGEGMELTFALPPTLDPDSVVESVLTVSGYYVRYSDLKGAGFYAARYLLDDLEDGSPR